MKEISTQNIKPILIKDINIEDDSFRMTFSPDLNRLKSSMEEVGLLNPVILRGKDRFQIVTGYRRILVAQILKWEKIKARIFIPDELSFEEGFKLNFYENLGTRDFNLIESAMAVSGFINRCKKEKELVQKKILPLLGFQSGSKILQQLLSLIRLVDEWKMLVVKKEISLPNAAKVSSFTPKDQRILFKAVSDLKLGENKLRQCLEMIDEICRRDEISFEQLFTSSPFTQLAQDEKLNITEKTELFRKALKARRYPEFTRQEEKFQKTRKKLTLPPSVRLEPPEFFEGDKLKVTFKFRSPEELRSILEKLETAAYSEALKSLLEML